ncbi:hypothetical protein H2O64_05200 [Kordia sp. YSTF-M3]|uniref:Uncharacterized protein n=1 Tax=Kordia aestuariivivens TaxID=2759037 RepID=A0ABR7Q6B0_9FLAO|nr:hypothetical protein [Kordia aestuariivivens]MBC8754057.1 hypothetical protein [Kordia aestuariivivens]
MEEEQSYDPFQLQYASSTRRFSLRTKLMAIVLVFIFVMIPLYEISPETFKLNHITQYVPCQIGIICGCFG